MYDCMERVLKGDAKAEFLQQANLVGSRTVANFTTVMATMTVHVFLTYAYRDQRRYMQRYLRNPPEMKARTFTTRLLQLNNYLTYFPPDRPGQPVAPPSEDKVKEIVYHAMPNSWKKKMVEQGPSYLDGSIQNMAEFFETRIENLERFDSKKESNKSQNTKSNKKRKHSNQNVSEEKNSQGKENGKKFCQSLNKP